MICRAWNWVKACTHTLGIQAVKEFSKTRLRKRIQSNILRGGFRRPGRMGIRAGPGPGMDPGISHELSEQRSREDQDALFLIREEIAIMKKLNHPNLVSLIEVLDDPEEDSLYMVLEMCNKGVIMKVGLEEDAVPYSEEECRHWFRDLILGIEYLHAQGVVHRDIKPDNLLLTDDDVLKIVDFGVSEMFEKPAEMRTAKSAGSPAFLPPELCVAKHGDVSGTAADVWSMGVSLYCLRYGHIPFNKPGVLEIYSAIKDDTPVIPEDESPSLKDLLMRLMDKDPETRITMPEIRVWLFILKALYNFTTDSRAGTPMGHQRRQRPPPQHRREPVRPRLTAQRARSKPCLHPSHDKSALRNARHLQIQSPLVFAFPPQQPAL